MIKRGTGLVTSSPKNFVKNAKVNVRRPSTRVRKAAFQLSGGPWDGGTAYLCGLPTLWLRIGDQKGRYDINGRWEALHA
jgi:hypothetical protein